MTATERRLPAVSGWHGWGVVKSRQLWRSPLSEEARSDLETRSSPALIMRSATRRVFYAMPPPSQKKRLGYVVRFVVLAQLSHSEPSGSSNL